MTHELVVHDNKWVTLGYHSSFSVDLTPLISDAKEVESGMFVGHILSCSDTSMIFIEIFNPVTCVYINGGKIEPHVCTTVQPGSILSFLSHKVKFPKFKLVLQNKSSFKISPVANKDHSLIFKDGRVAVPLRAIEQSGDFYNTEKSETMMMHRRYTDQDVCHPSINTFPTDLEQTTISPRRPDDSVKPQQACQVSKKDNAILLRKSATNLAKPFPNTVLSTTLSEYSETDLESTPKKVYQNSPFGEDSINIVDLATQTTLPLPVACRRPKGNQSLNLDRNSPRTRIDLDSGNDTLSVDFSIAPFVIKQGLYKAQGIPLSRLSMPAPKNPKNLEHFSEVYYNVVSARSAKCLEGKVALHSPPMSPSSKAALRLMDRVLGIRMKDGKVQACTELVTPFTDDNVRAGIVRDFESMASRLKHVLQSKPLSLKLSSPVFVCGDLRGELSDLRTIYNKVTFLNHWSATNVPVLFLGDYLGHSSTNLEVICLLFAWSLLCPDVHLLRGSNEFMESNDRVVNGVFFGTMPSKCTLLQQCRFCFGENSGRSLWSTINNILNKLPLVAVIDDRAFATHSGIPLLRKDERCKFVPDSGICCATSPTPCQPLRYQSESTCNCQDSPIKKGPCRFVPSETMFEEFLTCKCSRSYFEFESIDFNDKDSPYVSERRQLVRELLGNEPGYFHSSADKCKPIPKHSTERSNSETSTFFYDIDAEVDGFCCSIRSEDIDGSFRQFNDVALKRFLKRFKFSHLLRARGGSYIDDISHGGRIVSLTSSGENPYGCRLQGGKITLYSLKESASDSENHINIGAC